MPFLQALRVVPCWAEASPQSPGKTKPVEWNQGLPTQSSQERWGSIPSHQNNPKELESYNTWLGVLKELAALPKL